MTRIPTMEQYEEDCLNSFAEFDMPFRVEHGEQLRREDIWEPAVYLDLDDDGQATGDPYIDARDRWEFVDGYSGQDRYSGPIMHPSEYLGGRMAQDVLGTEGVYCVVECVGLYDDQERDARNEDPIGWCLLRLVAMRPPRPHEEG